MAHNNFYCLEKLLLLLDDSRNDIYLHIDKKVKDFNFDYFQKLCVNANIIYPKKRINVTWGTQSQVKTEMLLLHAARQNSAYHYYHILSGCDLPLKTQNEIHSYFYTQTTEFFSFESIGDYIDRVATFRFFFGNQTEQQRLLSEYADIIQRKTNINRARCFPYPLYKGANWASLTNHAVEILLKNLFLIMWMTWKSFCADEIYKQS